MYRILDLYKALASGQSLLPTGTNFDFWEAVYEENTTVMDREFARRFADFKYFDFLDSDSKEGAITNLKADVLSVLTFNKKRYEEMYRVFLVEDEDLPITYNYDMTETTGAQHTETEYGATSATKGQETFTKGEQINTEGEVTNSHNVAPMNSTTAQLESSDVKTSQQYTDGQRQDTNGSRTDTTLAHTDQYDSDEWTLTRKGNIGIQTGADIIRIFGKYWSEEYKFIGLIFDDICKQLLMIGD